MNDGALMSLPENIRAELRGEVALASLCSLLIGVGYLLLPGALHIGPGWLVLVIEAVFLGPLAYSIFVHPMPHHIARYVRFALQALLALALASSVILLIVHLPELSKAKQILVPAALLWISNILLFAQWYWELDGGGPLARTRARKKFAADFQFPQQVSGQNWSPSFIDYLFLAFCSSTALSPADTMPLTARAKLMMMAQALLSLLLIAMAIARAINIIQ